MKRATLLALACVLFSACSGGGGDGGGSDYAGRWRVNLLLMRDDCNVGPDATISATYFIDQAGERVAVNTGGGMFTGTTTDSGFEAYSEPRDAGEGCTIAGAIAFSDVEDDSAGVGAAFDMFCTNGIDCVIAYGGTAERLE